MTIGSSGNTDFFEVLENPNFGSMGILGFRTQGREPPKFSLNLIYLQTYSSCGTIDLSGSRVRISKVKTPWYFSNFELNEFTLFRFIDCIHMSTF